MRILLVTRDDPRLTVTGVAVYVRDLAEALRRERHEVAHLYLGPAGWRPRGGLRWSCRDGVPYVAVDGPPAWPAPWEHRLKADVSSPALERPLADALTRIRPDIVHVHDLSGLPATLIPAARARGCRVVVTLHDFWPFCRQLLLMRPGLVPCEGSNAGHNCARFCSMEPRGLRHVLRAVETAIPSPPVRGALRGTRALYRRLRGRAGSQFVPCPSQAVPQHRVPVLQAAHAEREAGMRSVLLEADLLLTVSHFAKATYVRHGYPAERIEVLPLAVAATEQIRRRPRAVQACPVRFGYVGTVTPWKGAHLLAEAVAGLSPAEVRVTFYGAVAEADRRFLAMLAGGSPAVSFAGRYTRQQLAHVLDQIDVVVFPSIVRETLGLVGLEAQAAGLPIIGAAHGAIPEYVRHEVTGLLFEPGSVASLRAQIVRIIRDPGLVARLASNVPAPQPMGAHVREVLRLYAGAQAHAGLERSPA